MDEKNSKWRVLIEACKKYYIDSVPTGMSDAEFDALERQALEEDNFSGRDYVFNTYAEGKRTQNRLIEKVIKEKVVGMPMIQAMENMENRLGKKLYWDLKYDGSSIAGYIDPTNGKIKNVVTVGNLNLDNFGIDQTSKLGKFFPIFPAGIAAIQCEAVIDVGRLENPERARQKANGLINSKYRDEEVNSLLTLIGYRYYFENPKHPNANIDYRNMLYNGFGIVRSSSIDNHLMFAPAQSWTLDELRAMPPGFTETDITTTNMGTFLNDGWVAYDEHGVCQGALKFAGAGSGDNIQTSTVKSIQWNDQVSKGKDSWSANVIIDPITLHDVEVKKPSAGSVAKLINKNITPGATVSIILANSTIPMVGDVIKPGNGDYMWPVCSCGYKLGPVDVYGSLLKCGNPFCSERLGRMTSYVGSLTDIHKDLDLGKLLVIDRFKWENTEVSIDKLLDFVEKMDEDGYYKYLMSFMTTELQKRNVNLVWKASFMVLRKFYEECE